MTQNYSPVVVLRWAPVLNKVQNEPFDVRAIVVLIRHDLPRL